MFVLQAVEHLLIHDPLMRGVLIHNPEFARGFHDDKQLMTLADDPEFGPVRSLPQGRLGAGRTQWSGLRFLDQRLVQQTEAGRGGRAASLGSGIVGRVGSRNRTVRGVALRTGQPSDSAGSRLIAAGRVGGRKLNFFEQIGPVKRLSDGSDDHLKDFTFPLEFHFALGGVDVDVNLVSRDRQKEDAQGKTAGRQQFPVAATQGKGYGLAFHRPPIHEKVLSGPGIAGTTGRTDEAGHSGTLLGQACFGTRERQEFLSPFLADHGPRAQGQLVLRRGVKHLASV